MNQPSEASTTVHRPRAPQQLQYDQCHHSLGFLPGSLGFLIRTLDFFEGLGLFVTLLKSNLSSGFNSNGYTKSLVTYQFIKKTMTFNLEIH